MTSRSYREKQGLTTHHRADDYCLMHGCRRREMMEIDALARTMRAEGSPLKSERLMARAYIEYQKGRRA